MAIEGPLKELGIHDVFQLLDLGRKTGVLAVTSELRRNRGTVYFDDGAVVYAEIEANPHRLGTLLVGAGRISEADLRRATDMQQVGDQRRLGEILVAIGALKSRELERQVRAQVEQVVFEMLSWREGHFRFDEGPLGDLPADATVRIATESLLMEGARRIDEWARIERRIPHLGVIPTIAPSEGPKPGQIELLPSEWEVLAAIDGERDLRTIAGALGCAEFDVAKTVFGLASAGLVAIEAPKKVNGDGARAETHLEEGIEHAEDALDRGDVESARRWAESVCSINPDMASPYVVLGRVEMLLGRPAAAEEHLRHALRLDALLWPAHRLLGDALALQGRHSAAIEWWERWLTIGEHSALEPDEIGAIKEAIAAARTLDQVLYGIHE